MGELLSLPVEEVERSAVTRRAKCSRRRDGMGRQIDEVCRAVNALGAAKAGAPLRLGGAPQILTATERQREVRRSFGQVIRRLGTPPAPAGARQELLKLQDVYDLDRQVTMRPYVSDRVKVVREGVAPRDILNSVLLLGHARMAAENPARHILKSDAKMAQLAPEDHVVPYVGPVLRGHAAIVSLVKKLAATGVFTFRQVCRSKVGVFCVAKKDGMFRLNFDCRPTNVLCKKPPTSELSTPNVFANLDFSAIGPHARGPVAFGASGGSPPLPADTDEVEGLFFSSIDLIDAFYQLGWTGLASYFCLVHLVRTEDFGITEVFDEITGQYSKVSPDDLLFPALAVLPIGSSWLLYFCHGLLTEAMLEGEARRHQKPREEFRYRLVQDRCEAPRLAAEFPILAPYVDNANLLFRGKRQAQEALSSLKKVLDEEGLRYREEFEAVSALESVGLVLDGPTLEIRNKPSMTNRKSHGHGEEVRIQELF